MADEQAAPVNRAKGHETVVQEGQDIMDHLRTLVAPDGFANVYVINGSGRVRNATLRKPNATVGEVYSEDDEDGPLRIAALHGHFIRGDEEGSKLSLVLYTAKSVRIYGYVEGALIASTDVHISYAVARN